ncbi:hypothetical protein ATY79_26375 [Rhizobium sp. R693]|nr:hypothetical protein ATY79_26375 [Rhizobium sp. R693]
MAPFSQKDTDTAYLGDHVEYEIRTSNGLVVIFPRWKGHLTPLTDLEIGFKDRKIAITGG